MPQLTETAERILVAFLQLVAERGIEGATTRTLAEVSGVNEVTIFRNFGDKATLVREAFRHFSSTERVKAQPIEIDVSTVESAATGLLKSIQFLRDCLREHPELLQLGMGEAWRYPDVYELVADAALTARTFLDRALTAAAPVLRKDVDPQATAMGLLGLVLITVIWQTRGWLQLTEDEWDRLLMANIYPLLDISE